MDQMVIQKKLIVGAFAPIEREPKWFLSLDDLFENQMAYPAYDGKKMVFKKGKLSELVLNSDFGVNILGPLEKAEIVSPDIFIIPGLGFSKKGKRLGRGKGHYDRALEKSSALKIGVAFDFQVEEDLPTKEYDVLMDFVVTDKKIYKKF